MINRNKGNHSINTWEDQYYDGYDVSTYDEKMVSDWMREGTEDCVEYLEVLDNEYFWYRSIESK
ncbi:hypothetical protein DN757_02160 [Paenibacillus silvae]|uniref:Uncharacterized protein n=1 Tax=Paenibacillus silvae TaxID=1325358 RepID=A0A2W6NNQ0_9BACL|nr:hypothetical protein DN757_02160 [Paenibacillus silvae]